MLICIIYIRMLIYLYTFKKILDVLRVNPFAWMFNLLKLIGQESDIFVLRLVRLLLFFLSFFFFCLFDEMTLTREM